MKRPLLALPLAVYLLTGVHQIRPEERAVVRRFGAVVARPGPGLWVGLPWGIDRVDRVPVAAVRRVVVGFEPEADDDALPTPPGRYLTGDENLVLARVAVEYSVGDGPADLDDFVTNRDRIDAVVGRAAEAALAEWVAGRDVDGVLLTGSAALPRWLARRTQERVAGHHLGVRVGRASVELLAPPDEVRPAFEDVNRAQTNVQAQVNRAEQEKASRLRKADGTPLPARPGSARVPGREGRLGRGRGGGVPQAGGRLPGVGEGQPGRARGDLVGQGGAIADGPEGAGPARRDRRLSRAGRLGHHAVFAAGEEAVIRQARVRGRCPSLLFRPFGASEDVAATRLQPPRGEIRERGATPANPGTACRYFCSSFFGSDSFFGSSFFSSLMTGLASNTRTSGGVLAFLRGHADVQPAAARVERRRLGLLGRLDLGGHLVLVVLLLDERPRGPRRTRRTGGSAWRRSAGRRCRPGSRRSSSSLPVLASITMTIGVLPPQPRYSSAGLGVVGDRAVPFRLGHLELVSATLFVSRSMTATALGLAVFMYTLGLLIDAERLRRPFGLDGRFLISPVLASRTVDGLAVGDVHLLGRPSCSKRCRPSRTWWRRRPCSPCRRCRCRRRRRCRRTPYPSRWNTTRRTPSTWSGICLTSLPFP